MVDGNLGLVYIDIKLIPSSTETHPMTRTTTRPTDRQLRAYAEASNYLVEPRFGSDTAWDVIKRDGTTYIVDGDTCSCPSWRHNLKAKGQLCKHIYLVRLHQQAEAMVNAAPVEPDPYASARADRARLWG